MNKTKIIEIEKRWKERFKVFEDMFKFRENISKNKTHLDFGCGIGTFARILAKKYPNVQIYGIDPNKEKIKIAKKKYKLPNLQFICSKKISGKYDSITSFFTLHEVRGDVQETLKDLYHHLNENGKIMIYEFRKRSRAKYREWYTRGEHKNDFEKEYKKHNKWTIKEFKQICKNVGLKTIEIRPIEDFWLLYIGRK